MELKEFGVLFVWWGVWSLCDRFLLPYSPVSEIFLIVIGFSLSRLLSHKKTNSTTSTTQTTAMHSVSIDTDSSVLNECQKERSPYKWKQIQLLTNFHNCV